MIQSCFIFYYAVFSEKVYRRIAIFPMAKYILTQSARRLLAPLVHLWRKEWGFMQLLRIMLSNCFPDPTAFIDMFNPLKAIRVRVFSHAWVARVLGHPLPPPPYLSTPADFFPLIHCVWYLPPQQVHHWFRYTMIHPGNNGSDVYRSSYCELHVGASLWSADYWMPHLRESTLLRSRVARYIG